ncbi:M48 family metalloprotease [Thalassotalea sp. LPB0316]|uniref:M48 family metalloprotease n=1 Tax=Thalassotalea sp. LPB0316 TaxID=2769490 RepID=UPI0018687E31|nr:M48 family metalloprotease [Thalassotalea sp. LPB0316]QOL26714.1 M48 family metalloprotease [Thalassotalea sp. LPB0316]
MRVIAWLLPLCLLGCGSTIKKKDVQSLTNRPDQFVISEEEQSLINRSNKLHNDLVKQGLIVRNKAANDYIAHMAQKIEPEFDAHININYFILRDSSLNAFALPNGNIYLNAGLINQLASEDELALILAHEIAHVVERHGLIKLIDRKQTVVSSHVVDLMFMGTGLIYFAAINDLASFSRQMEEQADELAIEYLANTDYDLSQSINAIEKLVLEKHGKELGSIWSSHPDISARAQAGREKISQMNWQAKAKDQHPDYEVFRSSLTELVIKTRLRNKQFELAEDLVNRELTIHPDNALMYYYLGEANRLKAAETKAYAREYAWLYDQDYDDDLITTLEQNDSEFFDKSQRYFEKSVSLNSSLSLPYKGLGLLALDQQNNQQAKAYLQQYLSYSNVKDRRYINSLLRQLEG